MIRALVAVGLIVAGCNTPQRDIPQEVYPSGEITYNPTPDSPPPDLPSPTEAILSPATVPPYVAFVPTAKPKPKPTAKPTPKPVARPARVRPGKRVVTGVATWYATGPGKGHAAAGPALRRALGRNWRGTQVRVCVHTRCVVVVLDDWCLCSRGRRVIDLSDEDFGWLSHLGRGVIPVLVTR